MQFPKNNSVGRTNPASLPRNMLNTGNFSRVQQGGDDSRPSRRGDSLAGTWRESNVELVAGKGGELGREELFEFRASMRSLFTKWRDGKSAMDLVSLCHAGFHFRAVERAFLERERKRKREGEKDREKKERREGENTRNRIAEAVL